MTTEIIRSVTRPTLIILLTLAWIIFIGEGIDTPAAYEAITAAAVAEWVLERGITRFRHTKGGTT